MAAPPARARADYDYLIKLLLIGDSGSFLPPFPFARSWGLFVCLFFPCPFVWVCARAWFPEPMREGEGGSVGVWAWSCARVLVLVSSIGRYDCEVLG